jgi:TldD protein
MHEYIDKILECNKNYMIEIFIEEYESSRIRVRGKNIEDISRSSGIGGHVRVTNNYGGFGFISFNDFKNINNYIQSAIDIADITVLSKKGIVPKEAVKFEGELKLKDQYSFDYKVNKIKEINENIYTMKGIDTTVISYGENLKTVYYYNSFGSEIIQEKKDLIASFTPVIKENGNANVYPFYYGSTGDFDVINKAEETLYKNVENLLSNNDIDLIDEGYYAILMDQEIAGVFMHEVIGHLVEADHLSDKLRLNVDTYITSDIITIADRPDIEGLRGSYKFDDEGTKSHGTPIITNGILTNFLHSCDTAYKNNKESTANARTVGYRYKPIVRMSNFFINRGTSTFDDILKGIEKGVYVAGSRGASTNLDKFVLRPREAYLIRNGKICRRLCDIYLTGDINTFNKIEKLSSEELVNQGVSCSKQDQRNLPISISSPHIFISSCFIGRSIY